MIKILRFCLLCLFALSVTVKSTAQCGDNNTGTACTSFAGTFIANVTTVNTATIGTWYNVNTTTLTKPYWTFKSVTAGTILRLASCTGRDAEFAVSGPAGFTNVYRDGDAEITGLGCTPGTLDESMYLLCTVAGDYNILLDQGDCANFTSPTTTNLYWQVAYIPCVVTESNGSSQWNGYFYDGTNQNYLYGSLGTFAANNISSSWGNGQPNGTANTCGNMCDADNFSSRYRMTNNYTTGFYKFNYSTDDGVRLSSTGGASWNLVNSWGGCSTASGNVTAYLSGSTDMRFEQQECTGGASASLTSCQIPGDKSFGTYPTWNYNVFYGNNNFSDNQYAGYGSTTNTPSGSPVQLLYQNYGNGAPAYNTGTGNCSIGSGTDNFSVKFRTNKTYTNGIYVFRSANASNGAANDDGAGLTINAGTSIDGTSYINNLACITCGSSNQLSNPVLLSGPQSLIYDMTEGTGAAAAALNECQMDAMGSGTGGDATAAGSSAWNLYYYNTLDYSFPMTQYRGTNVAGSSTATSATLSLSWLSGVAPTLSGQTCGTTMNNDFSMKGLLTRSFTRGIYSVQSGADDYSQIRVNGGSFFNTQGSCCITTTSNQALDGNTALEYQMYDNGGAGSATVNITCIAAVAGTLSSNQTCNGTGTTTLTLTGATGYTTIQSCTDGTSWTDGTMQNTVAFASPTWSQNPSVTTFYRIKVESCGTTLYSNTVAISRTATYTGNVVIATNTTLGGTLTITGDFTINNGATVTLPQGCPLTVNATNVYVNGTIDGDGAGGTGGTGGSGGSSSGGPGGGAQAAGGGAGGIGSGTGAGLAGTTGNAATGGNSINCTGSNARRAGAAGGSGGGGGSYGGAGGAGIYSGAGRTPEGGGGSTTAGAYVNGPAASSTYGVGTDATDITIGSGGSGGGGGGGGFSVGTNGGSGGNGGGAVILNSCNSLTVPGTIKCNGKNGGLGGDGGNRAGNGSSWNCTSCTDPCGGGSNNGRDGSLCTICYYTWAGAGGAGAGAGAGSGGGIELKAFGNISLTGSLTANGGNGGNAGHPWTSDGSCNDFAGGGAGGGGGRIKVILNPCATNTISPSTATANGGTGGTSGNAGTGNAGSAGTYVNNINHPSYTTLTSGTISTTSYTVCNNTTPATGFTADIPTGGAYNAASSCAASLPAYQYQWYVTRTGCGTPASGTGSGLGGGWASISGVTGQSMSAADVLTGINTVGTITTAGTYCFQRRTTSGGCYAWTTTVSVTIQSVPVAGSIGTAQTICNNTTPAGLTSTAVGTGDGSISYRWESSTTSSSTGFSTISGATSATYAPSALTATTWYRRYTISTLNSVACEGAATAAIQITVQTVPVAGSIGTSQTICNNTSPATLTSLVDGTGSGAISYRWEISTTSASSGFSTISGATGATYSPSALTATTWYRRYTISTLNSVACEGAATAAIQITVQTVPVAGSIGTSQTICNNTSPATLTSLVDGTGSGTITYRWESSTTSSSTGFGTISGATSATYSPSALTATTWYRRYTQSTVNGVMCESPATAAIQITVQSVPVAGSIGTAQTICTNTSPATLTSLVDGSGAGAISYRWESSISSSSAGFTTISGATSASYSPTALAVPTWYRRFTVSTLNGNVCESVATPAIQISIKAAATNAYLCAVSSSNVILTTECDEGTWTYYVDPADHSRYLFGINKNGNVFNADVTINVKSTAPTTYDVAQNASASKAAFTMGRYWNVNKTSGSITNPVSVRFFYNTADVTAMQSAASAWATAHPTSVPGYSTQVHAFEWFKTVGTAYNPASMQPGGTHTGSTSLLKFASNLGTLNGVNYQQYDGVTSFSGGTVGIQVFPTNGGVISLPVKLVSFTSTAVENKYITLDWTTATEVNNKGFEVERSEDGIHFTQIGWVDGNGNTTETITYSLNDQKVNEGIEYYYRLKQIDLDGNFEYSPVASASLQLDKGISISDFIPNPTLGKSSLRIVSANEDLVEVSVYSSLGQLVAKTTQQLLKGMNTVSFDFTDFAGGTYNASIKTTNNVQTKKIVITK